MASIQDDFQTRWWGLEQQLMERFGKKPDMEAILFLIGLQETGISMEKISKEQKQDLMHVAICSICLSSGYYTMEGLDKDGWPQYKQIKNLPIMNMLEQEAFLKDHILLYFENNQF